MDRTVPPSRPVGRPRTFDADRVAVTAAGLFDERGYSAVTMADVAEAAGVSRRALFHYFPSKPHLLWSGFEPYTDNLRTLLADAPADEALGALLARCLARAFRGPTRLDLQLARSRLRIVAAHPETFQVGQPAMTAVHDVLVTYLRTQRRPRVGILEAQCLASGVTAASFDAAVRWATTSQSLDELMRRAVAALGGLAIRTDPPGR